MGVMAEVDGNRKSAAALGGFVQNELSPHLKSQASPCGLRD